jgi:signal peptidase I
MEPGLRIGDNAFADISAFRRREPERGDVVSFRHPNDPRIEDIQRIVGLPGDTIHFSSGVLYVDGVPVRREPRGMYTPSTRPDGPAQIPRPAFIETLPGGKSYTVVVSANGYGSYLSPVQVPAKHYFVVGDFRDVGIDSRGPSGFGFVPRSLIEGHLIMIYATRDWSRMFSIIR